MLFCFLWLFSDIQEAQIFSLLSNIKLRWFQAPRAPGLLNIGRMLIDALLHSTMYYVHLHWSADWHLTAQRK